MGVETEIVQVGDLLFDDNNANEGTERGRHLVAKSFKDNGAGRSVLVDGNRKLIAGNKSAAAAIGAGIEEVIIVKVSGNQLVAVQRTDLDLDSADPEIRERSRLLAYYDNQSSFQGLAWDPASFKRDIAGGLDLSGVFTEDELLVILEPELVSVESEADDTFGSFSSGNSGDYVKFKFGDYGGQVERPVYEAFLSFYKRTQERVGAAILSDVLAEMFNEQK